MQNPWVVEVRRLVVQRVAGTGQTVGQNPCLVEVQRLVVQKVAQTDSDWGSVGPGHTAIAIDGFAV